MGTRCLSKNKCKMTLSSVNSKSIIGKVFIVHLILEWQPGVFLYLFLSEGGDGGMGRHIGQ